MYMHLLGIIIVEEIYIGAVFLLASLTGILSYAFTIYHLFRSLTLLHTSLLTLN